MKYLIILFLISCGQRSEEKEVAIGMCVDSCIERELKNNYNIENQARESCQEFVLTNKRCYTSDNKTFYYR